MPYNSSSCVAAEVFRPVLLKLLNKLYVVEHWEVKADDDGPDAATHEQDDYRFED